MPSPKMKIEIWSDIMCPFCYIGKRNLEKALDNIPFKENIEIEWKSFQLDPEMPEVPEHHNNIYQYLAAKKGISLEESQKLHQHVSAYAESVGLKYNFDDIKVTNSLKAHRLIQMAKTKALGDEAEEVFFNAYFTEGNNLNDEPTLIKLGLKIGLAESEVQEALTHPQFLKLTIRDCQEAQMIGVTGVPFFVINRKYAVVGAQSSDVLANTIAKAYNEWLQEQNSSLQIINGKSCNIDGECD